MKKTIMLALAILLLCSIVSAEDIVFSVDITNTPSGLIFNGAEIIQGSAPSFLHQPESGFNAYLMSFNNEELFRFNFSSSLKAFDRPGEALQRPIILTIPYFPNAKELNIYEGGKLALKVDLSEFAVCNENKVCEPEFETKICSDCIAGKAEEMPEEKEGAAQEGQAEEPELPSEEEGMEQKLFSPTNIAVIAAALFVLFMLAIALRRRKQQ